MKDYDFDYEIKHFSNRSSDVSNPQTRSLSIIVSFNALFQATDYHYVNTRKIRNNKDLTECVNKYVISKRISMKNVVFFPIYMIENDLIKVEKDVIEGRNLAGFCFFLKKDLRVEYEVVKITKLVKDLVFTDLKVDIDRYNSFLHDDVWVIVVGKPHGRNFIVYGRSFIEAKLEEINTILKKEIKQV